MSKAILISIQPKWCELIASGKKKIEVRKNKPTLETPFKCYIYCTKKTRKNDLGDYVLYEDKKGFIEENGVRFSPLRTSRVIGEFICDRVDEYRNYGFALRDKNDEVFDVGQLLSNACLSANELVDYIRGRNVFYAWHISELKIYDIPKDVCEFTVAQHEYIGKRVYRSYGGWKVKRVTNWCYVEELLKHYDEV